MRTPHSATGYWAAPFDEARLQTWARSLRQGFEAARVDLGLLFLSPAFFPHARQTLEILRVHAGIPLLIGCSSTGLIAGGEEHENSDGLVLSLLSLPGAELRAVRFQQEQVEEANGPGYWHLETGVPPESTRGWLVFADPFHLDAEAWLRGWDEAYRGLPILGGLASGAPSGQATQVYLNDHVFEDGGVALSVGGAVRLEGVVSQGCTPIGEAWTITSAERHLVRRIANRPAYEVLSETLASLTPREQARTRGNLFVGLAMNEYADERGRGDFLIRNLLGADPGSGAIALGAHPRPGQTLQFQRRDADAATEEFERLLGTTRASLGGDPVYGGCLCCCNGRGQHLFGRPHPDAGAVQQGLGATGLAGFFCNGEIGPVGGRNFLHGYTASLALFVGDRA